MSHIIWLGSTTLITLGKEQLLRDGISGDLVTNATVQATVHNETQDEAVGTFPMPQADEENGRYRGVIPYNQGNLAIGDRCRVEIFADAGSSKRLTVVMKASVKRRTG